MSDHDHENRETTATQSSVVEQIDRIPSYRSDELPRFIQINRLKFRVDAETLTGRQLRDVPIPPIRDTDDLWRVDNANGDRRVCESDVEDLRGGRFYSAPRFINAGDLERLAMRNWVGNWLLADDGPPSATDSSAVSEPEPVPQEQAQ